MKTQTKLTRIAVAAAIVGALALPAAPAMAASNTERAIIGALLGGLAGAAVSKGDTGAVAIGAVAGAALGASTGRASDHRYSRSYRETRPYAADTRYGRRDHRGYQTYDRYDTAYGYRR